MPFGNWRAGIPRRSRRRQTNPEANLSSVYSSAASLPCWVKATESLSEKVSGTLDPGEKALEVLAPRFQTPFRTDSDVNHPRLYRWREEHSEPCLNQNRRNRVLKHPAESVRKDLPDKTARKESKRGQRLQVGIESSTTTGRCRQTDNGLPPSNASRPSILRLAGSLDHEVHLGRRCAAGFRRSHQFSAGGSCRGDSPTIPGHGQQGSDLAGQGPAARWSLGSSRRRLSRRHDGHERGRPAHGGQHASRRQVLGERSPGG